MNILLDTATLLWICCDPSSLSTVARTTYTDPANKFSERRMNMGIDREKSTRQTSVIGPLKSSGAVRILPLRESAVLRLNELPDVHRDPFDRMLVCQAIDESLTILTPDSMLKAYPVATLW